jgi:hypothetical protein
MRLINHHVIDPLSFSNSGITLGGVYIGFINLRPIISKNELSVGG